MDVLFPVQWDGTDARPEVTARDGNRSSACQNPGEAARDELDFQSEFATRLVSTGRPSTRELPEGVPAAELPPGSENELPRLTPTTHGYREKRETPPAIEARKTRSAAERSLALCGSVEIHSARRPHSRVVPHDSVTKWGDPRVSAEGSCRVATCELNPGSWVERLGFHFGEEVPLSETEGDEPDGGDRQVRAQVSLSVNVMQVPGSQNASQLETEGGSRNAAADRHGAGGRVGQTWPVDERGGWQMSLRQEPATFTEAIGRPARGSRSSAVNAGVVQYSPVRYPSKDEDCQIFKSGDCARIEEKQRPPGRVPGTELCGAVSAGYLAGEQPGHVGQPMAARSPAGTQGESVGTATLTAWGFAAARCAERGDPDLEAAPAEMVDPHAITYDEGSYPTGGDLTGPRAHQGAADVVHATDDMIPPAQVMLHHGALLKTDDDLLEVGSSQGQVPRASLLRHAPMLDEPGWAGSVGRETRETKEFKAAPTLSQTKSPWLGGLSLGASAQANEAQSPAPVESCRPGDVPAEARDGARGAEAARATGLPHSPGSRASEMVMKAEIAQRMRGVGNTHEAQAQEVGEWDRALVMEISARDEIPVPSLPDQAVHAEWMSRAMDDNAPARVGGWHTPSETERPDVDVEPNNRVDSEQGTMLGSKAEGKSQSEAGYTEDTLPGGVGQTLEAPYPATRNSSTFAVLGNEGLCDVATKDSAKGSQHTKTQEKPTPLDDCASSSPQAPGDVRRPGALRAALHPTRDDDGAALNGEASFEEHITAHTEASGSRMTTSGRLDAAASPKHESTAKAGVAEAESNPGVARPARSAYFASESRTLLTRPAAVTLEEPAFGTCVASGTYVEGAAPAQTIATTALLEKSAHIVSSRADTPSVTGQENHQTAEAVSARAIAPKGESMGALRGDAPEADRWHAEERRMMSPRGAEPRHGATPVARIAKHAVEREDSGPTPGQAPTAADGPSVDGKSAALCSLHATDAPQAQPAERSQARATSASVRSIVDQIVQRAELRLGRSEAEMVIDLKPDVLGKVHLKITAESGRVLAEIRADNIATRSLIEAGLPELKTALAGRGLVVEAIAVSADVGSRLEGNSTRPRWSWEGPARHRASGTRPGVHGVRATGPSAISWFSGGRMHVVDCMA